MNYRINPTTEKNKYFDKDEKIRKEIDYFLLVARIIGVILSIIIMSLWWPIIGGIGLVYCSFWTVMSYIEAKREVEKQIKQENEALNTFNTNKINEAQKLSARLNLLLEKSNLLVNNGIPRQIEELNKNLEQINFEFKDNALIPFWDEVESFVTKMNSLQESHLILNRNRQTYFKIIAETDNNFPSTFPNNIRESETQNLISNFKIIQREAFKKFEFANLWEQRKTQKILAFGFSTLREAVDNMSNSIVASINELNMTVESGFSTLSADIKNLQFNTYVDLSKTNMLLEKNLNNIDNKLYYIQYNKKPIEPFVYPIR